MSTLLEIRPAEVVTSAPCSGAQFAALFIALATVMVAPLAIIDLPLLADYPNHVTRMHIIGNFRDDPWLAERYAVNFDLLPNIAMDLVVPGLAKAMPIDVAARIFLGICLVVTLAGTASLHRTLFNLWSPYSLLAGFFVYHGSMMAGMANFSLGVGLVPLSFAIWVRMLDARTAWRVLAGSMIALLLFFCHLVAVGVFGMLIFGCAVSRVIERRHEKGSAHLAATEFGIAAASGLLPLLLFLRLLIDGEGGSAMAAFAYGDAAWKAKALLSPLANYDRPLDIATFAVLAGLALIAWRAGWLQVDRRIAPGLGLLALAFVLAPKALWTGGVFDQRLAVALALLLVAGSCVTMQAGTIARLLPVLLTLLLLARIGVLASTWADHRGDLAEMRLAIQQIAPGTRVLVVRPDKNAGPKLAPPRHWVFHHAVQLQSLPALAVIEKSAFVSTLYAVPGQQPLALMPPFDRLGGEGHVDLPTLMDLTRAYRPGEGDPEAKPQIRTWTRDFDYVVLIYGYGQGIDTATGSLPLEPLMDGDILDLFRIVRD